MHAFVPITRRSISNDQKVPNCGRDVPWHASTATPGVAANVNDTENAPQLCIALSFKRPYINMTDTVNHHKDVLQLVGFMIAGEEFGVDILKVQEIIRPLEITRVPNAPAFVEGVINLRGRIIPVIDLRKRFGLPAHTDDEAMRILVVELQDKVVGFVSDAVREVLRVEADVIEPAPDLAVGIDAHYIESVAKLKGRLVILLDMDAVLSVDEKGRLAPLQESLQEPEQAPLPEAA